MACHIIWSLKKNRFLQGTKALKQLHWVSLVGLLLEAEMVLGSPLFVHGCAQMQRRPEVDKGVFLNNSIPSIFQTGSLIEA